ncbi:MAG: hypothetical protein JOZ90_05930 [Alphaproteobacteria bacterium]|nr:hypothetical protein [Alphaproteobacteria bacterium]MBV9373232.1 hypothetical protein [Alphaproteobacteria bacterium]MBV9900620.1 hypothetical protein [Alphaproteobacteria bacterium]
MTRNMRWLATGSVLAAAAFAASPAAAAGTAAGTSVTNNVTLDYKVGGVAQTAVAASDTFTVDRKVVMTVVSNDGTTISVSPGQVTAVTTFTVTNASNATLDFALSAAQLAGGTAAHGGTDNFNANNVRVFVDGNGNGTYESASDTATYMDQIIADDSRKVFVVVDIPLGRATGDVAGVKLTAVASEATAAGSLGATVTQTSGANTAGVDTVFAEPGSANGNVQYDGQEFAFDDYTVSAAALTVTKTSRVISDPVNSTTNPKMIPGAVVEYCIAVANAAGSATATNISVTDTLPAQTTYLSAFGIKVNGTVTGSTCNADGASGGSYASGVVSGALADITAGTTKTLVFRTTVN